MTTKILISILLFTLSVGTLWGQSSKVREYEMDYKTYSFSDPNPIPVFGKVYPYFRNDGYTNKPQEVTWKVVELENDYLRIKIFPQIGGKIWSVYDKIAKHELFYDNDVVKFRDISLRGPWTSGGVEFNYGVVGHSPTCSFPVDYLIRENKDGSVSCIIGVLDLLTRSHWSVEINLPMDKGWFTTRSFWHNSSDAFQPYYNWVNTGVAVKKDLNFVYPGTHLIRHDGITFPWPIDKENKKDLSVWADNNFIGSKSYHIAGSHSPYWGAYWADDDFGMMHYAEQDEKIGRKIFSWALSDQGKIWEELLTDTKGQYVELQSGRLFNQNMVQSSLTPYKQIQFTPYGTDTWTEYWFPYKGTGGVSDATLLGVVRLEEKGDTLNLKFAPLQNICDTFEFFDSKGMLLLKKPVAMSVAKTCSFQFVLPSGRKVKQITLAGQDIWNHLDKQLNRPLYAKEEFDWNTAYGSYLRGRDLMGLRLYDQAETFIKQSLKHDPNYLPSLAEMAALYYNRMEYDSAYQCATKALAIDQYDAKANYEYGRAAGQLDRMYDALDGFELAALTTPLRSAAYTELSRLYIKKGVYNKASGYAEKSMVNNAFNISGMQLLYLAKSIEQGKQGANDILYQIEAMDLLGHFVDFERYYADRSPLLQTTFLSALKAEFAEQEIMELVTMYHSLGLFERCKVLLSIYPQLNAEMRYWQAYLYKETEDAALYLNLADQSSVYFVFPFREESKMIFEWAINVSANWKPSYLLALLHASRNNTEKASSLLSVISNADFSPLYSFRASLTKEKEMKEKDLLRAMELSPSDWRYLHQLTQFYLAGRRYKDALEIVESHYAQYKEHFPTSSLYVKVLICNDKYEQAERILSLINILPFEGEGGGRLLYQETKLMLALKALEKGHPNKACKKINEALLWPRNLGVGKPYDDIIDTRLENWLMACCLIKDGKRKQADEYLQKVVLSELNPSSTNTLLQALALCMLGNQIEGDSVFQQWMRIQKYDETKLWGKSFYTKNKADLSQIDFENMSRMIKQVSGTSDARLF